MQLSQDKNPRVKFDLKICSTCSNVMRIHTHYSGSQYRCRVCPNHTVSMSDTDRVVVVRTEYGDSTGDAYLHIPTEVLMSDPTLPRIHMACTHEGCDADFVVYRKIDRTNLRYEYVCPNGHRWTNRIVDRKTAETEAKAAN